jgi:tetratricopeptide (TPR) repeat protein
MKKESILFAIIGILIGLIIGFMYANSFNRGQMAQMQQTQSSPAQTTENPNMPAGHPDISNQPIPDVPDPMPQIQPLLDNANKNATDFEAQIKAAEALNQAQKYEDAAEYLKIALKLKPDNYETIVNLGNVNFDGGHFDEAEKWYNDALKAKKDDGNVRTDLGLTFMFRDKPNYERAIEEFQSVLTNNPQHIQALQNLTFAYTQKGDKTKASETLAKLESVDPQNKAIANLKKGIEGGK